MAKRFYEHTTRPGLLFNLAKNPATVADTLADETYSPRKAAAILGTDTATVKELIDDGTIEADPVGDGVDGADLAQFVSELTPAQGGPDAQNGATAPRRGTGNRASQIPGTPRVEIVNPPTIDIDCPSCKTPLSVAAGVHEFDCPSCGATLRIADDDQAANDNGNGRRPGRGNASQGAKRQWVGGIFPRF